MNVQLKKMLEYNRVFVDQELYTKYQTTKYPDRKIAILACMDTRMTELLPAALGLKNGDVKLIKNAGAQISHPYGSAMFSLIVAIYELGVDTVLVIGHGDCGGQALNGEKMIQKMIDKGIPKSTIEEVNMHFRDVKEWLTGFDDVCQSVQNTVAVIKNHPLIHKDVDVLGFIMDPETGALKSVEKQ